MRAHIFVFLLVLAVALAQQTCYRSQGSSSGSTNCQIAPFYSTVQIRPLSTCDYLSCSNATNNGVDGDSFVHYTYNFTAIPRPRKYVQLTYYSDVQCLNPTRIEFLSDSLCGTETSFYATCNQTHARVIRYNSGCVDVVSDDTYALNQCAGGPDEFISASCGTSNGTGPNTPTSAPTNSYPPRYYAPITRRATPLTCYINYDMTQLVLYNTTDASAVCLRYDYTCPPNRYNYTNYCTEGSTIRSHTVTSRETCNSLMQYPQSYSNVVCCETNYCNGDQPTNVSAAVSLVPSLFTSLWAVTWLVSFVAFLPRIK